MYMKIYSIHVPENILDLPSIKTKNDGDIKLELEEFNFPVENLSWPKVEEQLNTIVIDEFLNMISEMDSDVVENTPIVGIVWIYSPTNADGVASHGQIKYAQVVLTEDNLVEYFGKELAVETQLEFFEAI